jgi:hypothetical protein
MPMSASRLLLLSLLLSELSICLKRALSPLIEGNPIGSDGGTTKKPSRLYVQAGRRPYCVRLDLQTTSAAASAQTQLRSGSLRAVGIVC